MQIVAVLLQVLGVGVVERQPVAAGLQLSHVVVAFPVLVARHAMRVEAVVVRTLELFFLAVNYCGQHKSTLLTSKRDTYVYMYYTCMCA